MKKREREKHARRIMWAAVKVCKALNHATPRCDTALRDAAIIEASKELVAFVTKLQMDVYSDVDEA